MKLLSIIFSFFISFSLHAELINIGIYPDSYITSFEFSPKAGKYSIFTEDGKLKEIGSSDKVDVNYKNGKIIISQDGATLGNFDKVNFIGTGWYNHFSIFIQQPFQKEIKYDDNLKLVLLRNKMQMVNNIDLDNYIAGVVEAEVGRKPNEEYFKLQGIICRTYALDNLQKHFIEGYNLCDQVHCQAYNGKTFYEGIVSSVMQTRGIVVVDSDIALITAAFHSSCGGQTANSEDVWSKSLYYLRSVNDSFCVEGKNAHWQKEIKAEDWEEYLRKELSISNVGNEFYSQNGEQRKVYFFNDRKLSMEEIRNDWKLRSTFFEIEQKGDEVILKGRGFGHGVGLCQIGAMEMAKRGYSYSEILQHYYQGVHIVNLSSLDFFRDKP